MCFIHVTITSYKFTGIWEKLRCIFLLSETMVILNVYINVSYDNFVEYDCNSNSVHIVLFLTADMIG